MLLTMMTRRRHYHLPFCYFATVSLVVGRSTAAYYSSTVFVAGQQAASRSSTIGLSASSTATNSDSVDDFVISFILNDLLATMVPP